MDLQNLKYTLMLRALGLAKIPLFAFCSPSIVELTDTRMVLKIPLGFRTRNHLGVMYFGALNIGGEASIGAYAFLKIRQSGRKIDFLFKDYQASFHKRADGDVHFICDEVDKVTALIEAATHSPERFNATLKSYAIVPSRSVSEKVAEFAVTLTVKRRK